MDSINRLVRPNISSLIAYKSARDEFMGSASIYLDANENPFGKLNRYPDPNQNELKKKLCAIKNCYQHQVFLGNGSDECIDLLLRIFCNPGVDKCLTFVPTYGMYKVSAQVNDIDLIEVPLDNSFQINRDNARKYVEDQDVKVIFICSPNNPTGNSINKDDIEWILSSTKGIVVIDEAYIDFSNETSWSLELERYERLVVLQTLSKAWGMANLRVGLAMSNPIIIDLLKKVKPPYNISGYVQDKALELLAETDRFRTEVDLIKLERDLLVDELKKLPQIKRVYPTVTNFILVAVDNTNTVYKQLKDRSTIVRNRTTVVPNGLRITVGRPEENDILLEQLKEILK